MTQVKRKINAKELAKDIKSGMPDSELMQKHHIPRKALDRIFEKLVNAKVLTREEISEREAENTSDVTIVHAAPVEESFDMVWQCPSCAREQPREYDECPFCGAVVSKVAGRKAPEAERTYAPPVIESSAAKQIPARAPFEPPKRPQGSLVASLLGLSGCWLILLGPFLPIVQVPVIGGIGVFQIGGLARGASALGLIYCAIALIGMSLVFGRRLKWLWVPGVLAAIVTIVSFASFGHEMEKLKGVVAQFSKVAATGAAANIKLNLGGLPLSQWADHLDTVFSMAWGWLAFPIGIILLVITSIMAYNDNRAH